MEEADRVPSADDRKRVLIVEDNDADFLLLERQVKKLLAPRCCSRAVSRMELELALQQPWDLIISDFHLPDIEGMDLITTITAAQPATPCLLLSGYVEGLQKSALASTVFEVLDKGDSVGLRAALTGSWQPR